VSIARPTQLGNGYATTPKDNKTPALTTSHQVGRVYVININQGDNSEMVVTVILTFNSTPLIVLFYSEKLHIHLFHQKLYLK